MVGNRSEKTSEALSRVNQKAERQLAKNRNAVAELEGGLKQPVKDAETSNPPPIPTFTPKTDPPNSSQLKSAEAEVRRLRQLAERKEQESSLSTKKVDEMRRQNESLKAELNEAEDTMQTLRGRLAEEVAKATKPKEPVIDPATAQRLAAAEAEVRRLRELASQAPEQASREKSRADDMRRQNDALKAELESAQGLEGLPERQRKCNEANQFVVVVVVELSTGELTCQHSTATGSSKVEDRGPWEYVLEHGRKRTGELPSFGYNGSIKPHRVSAGTPSFSLIAPDRA
jgi:hypothetical protein